jgi:uncharacterized protein YgbK (DUF1537 family)
MNLGERIASLPPPRSIPGARRALRDALVRSSARLVAIDDDPTGTQTVHDVRVLMEWTVPVLARALARPEPLFYVSTNSRSLSQQDAASLARGLGAGLREAAAQAQVRILAASRSDSTLRGHFPSEVDALAAELPARPDGVLLVPAFFDAGRYTIDNVHWVDTGDRLVPAHETEFARDPDFGFAHSDLREWVQEKTRGRVKASEVVCIGIEDIREGGPGRVADVLAHARGGVPIVANAACDADLEVLALGVSAAEEQGTTLLYRTSASFVKVRAGVEDRPLLTRPDMGPRAGHGLVVAGSYVGRTSTQIDQLAGSARVLPIEVSVPRLLSEPDRRGEILRASRAADDALAGGTTALLFTSRQKQDAADFLAAGRRIMEGLCEVVRGIEEPPGFIVAKGGITSMAIARTALGCSEAFVLGQVLKGVPVWRLGPGSRWSDVPYVVFPGNVGGPTALRDVVAALSGGP